MAYAALDSLRNRIDEHNSRKFLISARREVENLEAIVIKFLMSSTSSLDLQMGVAISKLQQSVLTVGSHSSRQRNRNRFSMKLRDLKRAFLSSTSSLDLQMGVSLSKLQQSVLPVGSHNSRQRNRNRFSMKLRDLKRAFLSTIEMLKKMEEEYAEEGRSEGDDDGAVSSRIGFGTHNTEKVRSSPQYVELKRRLMSHQISSEPITFSLVGMPGIGKTTLAMEIFKDPDILKHFDCLAWVTVGREYRFDEIGRCILAEVDPDRCKMLEGEDEDCIVRNLRECLKGKKYFVVLDDIRNKYMAYHLNPIYDWVRAKVINPFPNMVSECRVLLTTRIQQVNPGSRVAPDGLTMRLLDKEESWDLLREKVFGEKPCPFQLEKDGKKIAEICRGLPLTIVTVADHLSKIDPEMTPQYWSEVATKRNHQLFKTVYNEISKVLYSCYKDLTHLLKLCFLYMCIFPQNYEIPSSKIIIMWNVDGFIQINSDKFPCPSALQCLEELVSNSLIMIYQYGSKRFFNKPIKLCGLHPSLWHLSNREAKKSKFAQVLDTYDDCFGESIKSQSRLSFHNNILLGFKKVYESVEDNCASTTHSLLFYGPYHQYQVPLFSNLVLLKELDALTIRFYEFPIEVLQLVELRFLALTVYGKIPTSISQLSNLQFLIIGRHLSIKRCNDPSFLPIEIWNMRELKHLQVMGNDFPDPCGTSLESLETLKSVSAHSCAKSILRAIPNLQKLGIQIELEPSSDGEPLSCFDHISHLEKLSSLKCVVMNSKVVPALAPLSISSFCLKKLSLSGLGYPWEKLSKISSSVPYLDILKLRNYVFQGPIWEVKVRFRFLCVLVIEDTDLVEWTIEDKSFANLISLKMKHCYKLEKIRGKFPWEDVELVDCNPLGVKQIEQAMDEPCIKPVVRSSWEAKA